MKFPKLTEDLSIISKLGDNPGTDNDLTSEGLKAKFDEASLILQSYINGTLVDPLNEIFAGGASTPNNGLNMNGAINMNNYPLMNLREPVTEDEAINYRFAKQKFVPKENLLIISDTEPSRYPAFWFDTSRSQAAGGDPALILNEDESNSSVHVDIDGETYGAQNATVNMGPTEQSYDFTVL